MRYIALQLFPAARVMGSDKQNIINLNFKKVSG